MLHNLLIGRISILCRCGLLLQTDLHGLSVCLSVCMSVIMLSPEKQPNRSRCCLGCGRRNHLLDGVQIPPMRKDNLQWEIRYVHGKWLAEIILLQQNPSFGETPDQVHFSCRKLCRKVTKYDAYILCLTASVSYELFERPSYTVFECSESNSITLAAVHIMSQISTLYAFTAEPRLPKWT